MFIKSWPFKVASFNSLEIKHVENSEKNDIRNKLVLIDSRSHTVVAKPPPTEFYTGAQRIYHGGKHSY